MGIGVGVGAGVGIGARAIGGVCPYENPCGNGFDVEMGVGVVEKVRVVTGVGISVGVCTSKILWPGVKSAGGETQPASKSTGNRNISRKFRLAPYI